MPSRNLTVGLAGTSGRNGAWAGADSPKKGGGRKSAFETIAGLDEVFLRVLERR